MYAKSLAVRQKIKQFLLIFTVEKAFRKTSKNLVTRIVLADQSLIIKRVLNHTTAGISSDEKRKIQLILSTNGVLFIDLSSNQFSVEE